MAIDVCASLATGLNNAFKACTFLFYTKQFMDWFGPTPFHFSRDTETDDYWFKQWEKCIIQKGDVRYFTDEEIQRLIVYCEKLTLCHPIADVIWQMCLNVLGTPYSSPPSSWCCVPKVQSEMYYISTSLWDFIFHVAIQRKRDTDTIPDVFTIPQRVTENWISTYPTEYFECRALGNRRFEFVKQDDGWKSFSMVLRTTEVLEDGVAKYIRKQPAQTSNSIYSATDILAVEAKRLTGNPDAEILNPMHNIGNKALYHLWSKCNVSEVNHDVLTQLIDIVVLYENETPLTRTVLELEYTPWNIILELAVMVQYTQTIQVPDLVTQFWIASQKYSMKYFGCRVFGDQRYVELSSRIGHAQAHDWLKSIIRTVHWDTDDVQPLHDILVELRNNQFTTGTVPPAELFLPSDLEPIIGQLLQTSPIQAWKVVYRMCPLTKLNTAYDNQTLVNYLTRASETDMNQEWFSYASSILMLLRVLWTQPSQGFTPSRYEIIQRCHRDIRNQELHGGGGYLT